MVDYNRIIFFGTELKISPIAFYIGNKPIYFYGIIIAIGFFLAIVYAWHEAKRTGFDSDHITNVVLIATPVAIVCARLYYVAFNFESYKNNLKEIFAIWNGGIAIYGALIGACLAGFFYSKYKNISFLNLADVACGSLFIGQMIGRWGNFVNSEAYGTQTMLPWKMGVIERGQLIYVHPTFLYESLWNFFGFLILLLFKKKKRYNGQLFYFYIVWYGLGRIWIEGLRTDSLQIGTIRVSQLVALACIITGTVLMIYNNKKNKARL